MEPSDRPDPGITPDPWPEESADRLREQLRRAGAAGREQVTVLHRDLHLLFHWIDTRNGTKGQAGNRSGLEVIRWWMRLVERVAEEVCNCRGPGDRPIDAAEHSVECPYRRIVNAT